VSTSRPPSSCRPPQGSSGGTWPPWPSGWRPASRIARQHTPKRARPIAAAPRPPCREAPVCDLGEDEVHSHALPLARLPRRGAAHRSPPRRWASMGSQRSGHLPRALSEKRPALNLSMHEPRMGARVVRNSVNHHARDGRCHSSFFVTETRVPGVELVSGVARTSACGSKFSKR